VDSTAETIVTVAATMKLLTRPRLKPPSSHACLNELKSSESGIEKPVTRSDRLWKASRTMLSTG
jgi:hypothetical protein